MNVFPGEKLILEEISKVNTIKEFIPNTETPKSGSFLIEYFQLLTEWSGKIYDIHSQWPFFDLIGSYDLHFSFDPTFFSSLGENFPYKQIPNISWLVTKYHIQTFSYLQLHPEISLPNPFIKPLQFIFEQGYLYKEGHYISGLNFSLPKRSRSQILNIPYLPPPRKQNIGPQDFHGLITNSPARVDYYSYNDFFFTYFIQNQDLEINIQLQTEPFEAAISIGKWYKKLLKIEFLDYYFNIILSASTQPLQVKTFHLNNMPFAHLLLPPKTSNSFDHHKTILM